MNKETKSIVARIAKTLADGTSNLENTKNKYINAIASCERTIDNSENKMLAASIAEDSKAYIAAKREKEDAESEREMYQRRLSQTETDGIISDIEARQIVENLKAAESDEFQSLTKELKELAIQITSLKHAYDEALKELNDLNSLLPEIKPGMPLEPLAIRMGNSAFMFAVYAENFAKNN